MYGTRWLAPALVLLPTLMLGACPPSGDGPTTVSDEPPTATITSPAPNASFAAGASVTFAGSGNDPEDGALSGNSLVWTSSLDGQIGTGSSFSLTTLSIGTHAIRLTATDSKPQSHSAARTITIKVNQQPTASISAPAANTSFPLGTAVTFTGSGNDPETGVLVGASLEWASSLDGLIGSGQSVTTTALSLGSHHVTLTATDELHAAGTASIEITIVSPAPMSAFSVTCLELTCTFTDQSTDSDGTIDSWSWVFGDGAVSTTQSPSHTFSAEGTYTVTLTVTDNDGRSADASTSVTVSLNNVPPTAAFGYSCTGLNCTFADSSTDTDGSVASWRWTFGDSASSSASSPSHTYASAGTYTVVLQVTDDDHDSSSTSRTVTVVPPNTPPQANISAPPNNSSFPSGTAITFTGSGSDQEDGPLSGAALVWVSSQDGQIGTGTSVTTSALSTGGHQITLKATDSQSASGTASIALTITNQPPSASFSDSCTHLSCRFTDQSTDSDGTIVAWHWNFGDGGTSTTQSPIHTYTAAGTYTVVLIATDNSQAPDTTSKSVTVTEVVVTLSGKIVFTDNRVGGLDQWEVFAMTPDGNSHMQITSELSNSQTEDQRMHPVVSPDGQLLVYERWNENPFTGIEATVKVARADGSDATRLIVGSEPHSPSVSPSGAYIALVDAVGLLLTNATGTLEVYVRPWPVSELYNDPIMSPQAWWPTQSYIFFSMRPDVGIGMPQHIYYFNFDDATINSANVPASSWYPSISVDGWMAYTSDIDGNDEIYVVDMTAPLPRVPVRITNNSARDDKPVWSPDGSHLLFVSNRDGNDEIYMVSRSGTGLTNLTRHPASQTDPFWVP